MTYIGLLNSLTRNVSLSNVYGHKSMSAHSHPLRRPLLAISKFSRAPKITVPKKQSLKTSEKSVISLTKMITYYGRLGELQKAMKLFDDMPCRNQVSYNAMLAVLVNLGQLDAARQLFAEMPARNSTSYTLMISGFSKLGLVVEAREVFDSIPWLCQNVVLWTAMISCYVQNLQPLQALKFFSSSYGEYFALQIIPNSYTFSILVKSSVDVQSPATATQVHSLIIKLLNEETKEAVFVQNALIGLHSKFGSLFDAERIFNRLKLKDLSSWNTMMACYTRHFSIDKALRVFNSMKEKDTLSWNIIISGLAESGSQEEAIKLFLYLLRFWPETKPNPSTYTIILNVCSVLSMLRLGREIHAHTVKVSLNCSNVFIGNSLITMYAHCGVTEESEKVFDEMLRKDIVSWNSLVLGLGHNGCARKALEVAEKALTLGAFNQNTFIGILTSCSHEGLVEEGLEYFSSMSSKYGIIPDLNHHICVIDMFGRMGRIIEAHDFLCGMPLKANCVAWAALLSACLVHGNWEIGEIAARQLQILEPNDVRCYAMLANLYGKIGRIEESRKIFNLMKERGLRKNPGCSWIVEI